MLYFSKLRRLYSELLMSIRNYRESHGRKFRNRGFYINEMNFVYN